jgi:hypothetical protein
MKTNKPQNQPVAHQDDLGHRLASGFHDAAIRKLNEDSLPTVSELAQLAALLAQGKSLNPTDCAGVARQAIELWTACDEERKTKIMELELRELARAQDAAIDGELPTPKAFPVNFDNFLRLALPKKRLEDREKIYRESIRARLLHDRRHQPNGTLIPIDEIPLPTNDECGKVIAEDRATGFNEFQFQPCLIWLRRFAAWYEKGILRIRGKAAGLKSAQAKKKRKARPPVQKLKDVLLT